MQETAVRAGRKEWIGLAVLGLPTLLVALDIGALFLALPHLSVDLQVTSTQQLWITDIYGFMVAGLLITMGTLGDRIGRRKLLLIGAAGFGVMSVVAAYSTSAEGLIASRALLGIAGATLMPSTLALITNMFRDDNQRRLATALWVSCVMTGSAIGPVVGGLLLNQFWWGSVFLLGVPIMAILLITGPVLLPEYRDESAGRLDLVSVALSLAGILPLVYGLKEIAVHGLESPALPIAAMMVGAIFLLVFIRRQLRLPHPLLDLRLFRNGVFSATLTSMLLAAAVMAGMFLMVSQYVQTVLGFSPAKAGIWLLPAGIAIAVGAQLGPMLAKRMPAVTAISLGLAVGAAGFAMIAAVGDTSGLALIVAGLVVFHVCAGPLFALGTYLVIGAVPPERAGSAASMSETANTLGTTFGLALMGTTGVAIYRHQMEQVDLSGLPEESADAARDTVAGATAVAQELPPSGLAENLLRSAQDAFINGMTVVAILSLITFLGLAILLFVVNRSKGGAAQEQAAATTPEAEGDLATAEGARGERR